MLMDIKKLNLLSEFASQIKFKKHPYIIEQEGGEYALSQHKTGSVALKNLIKSLEAGINEATPDEELSLLALSLDSIYDHLQTKTNTVFSKTFGKLFSSQKRKDLKADADYILKLSTTLRERLGNTNDMFVRNDKDALLCFYSIDAPRLGIKNAAQERDSQVIQAVSSRLWANCGENYEEYRDYMTRFFKGEHFVFLEDTESGESLYTALQEGGAASFRASSHYDHGTVNHKINGALPHNEGDVDNPQFGISSRQLKHLVFGRVTLARNIADDKEIIYGKTYDQAMKSLTRHQHPDLAVTSEEFATAKEEISKQYSKVNAAWLQTERTPDSPNVLKANFWNHRIRDFFLYAFRKKILHSETPNVGPYGYGHGDDHPSLIEERKIEGRERYDT